MAKNDRSWRCHLSLKKVTKTGGGPKALLKPVYVGIVPQIYAALLHQFYTKTMY